MSADDAPDKGPSRWQRVVEWLRVGYPTGVPRNDYQPLLALLRRQLTEDEVQQVSGQLIAQAPTETPGEIERVDAGVLITKYLDDVPADADIERVAEYLRARGWPLLPHTDKPNDPSDPDDPDDPDGPGA